MISRRDLLKGLGAIGAPGFLVEVISGDGLVAVPYYAWNSRGKGEMAVWIPYR